MKKFAIYLLIASVTMIAFSCQQAEKENTQGEKQVINTAKGKLFIIGGGKRPPALVKELYELAGLNKGGYGIILPMSSSEPDTSAYYAKLQFTEQGIENVTAMHFKKGDEATPEQADSLRAANLIYISGGDQNRFMEIVKGTSIEESILAAYQAGAVIAGTSAGAAVMSDKMITGNELRHPDYRSTFRNIESQNIEIKAGLGLIKTAIIDQHFVKRSRYNRLFSAVIEYPDLLSIGIDESTAIVVSGDSATVTGNSQVILMENPSNSLIQKDTLLGADGLKVSILLPGKTFSVVK
ncbi:MAG: cyanophycinase [Flammeovirgaceae bacterium]